MSVSNGMSLIQMRDLFYNISQAHKEIGDFAFGELWEIEEKMNKEALYNMLYVSPVQSVTMEQVKERTFMIMVMDIPSKRNNNTLDVWSDAERILDDIVKILRRESQSYELVGDPVLIPFKEDNSDWVSGYRAEVVIRTNFASNYCDIPSNTFISPDTQRLTTVTIKDQDGNIIATLKGGQSYEVTILTGIEDTITANVTTIVDDII